MDLQRRWPPGGILEGPRERKVDPSYIDHDYCFNAGEWSFPDENPSDRTVGTMLNAHSTGVVGIKNLELKDNSVLVTGNKEVKLDMGSQILIKAE